MSIHCYAYAYVPVERTPYDIATQNREDNSLPSPGGPLFGSAAQLGTSDSPSNIDRNIPPNSQFPGVNSKLASQWLMEETPVPPSWRDSRPHGGGDEFDLNAQISVINSILMDLHDEDEEEIVGPDHWLQRIASIPIDQET
jgi:hypothetical protein